MEGSRVALNCGGEARLCNVAAGCFKLDYFKYHPLWRERGVGCDDAEGTV